MATHFFGLTSRTYKYSHAVGRAEFAGTGFRNPTDMAIAADGTVYICNRSYENRPDGVHITVLTLDEEYVTEFGTYGEADGEFMWPTSIVLDSKGNRSEEHTSELQSRTNLVCRLLLEKKKHLNTSHALIS